VLPVWPLCAELSFVGIQASVPCASAVSRAESCCENWLWHFTVRADAEQLTSGGGLVE
jgi:hypothetical protein